MRFGDVEVLVEVMSVAGTEPTSIGDWTAGQVVDVLGRARTVVHSVAASTAGMLRDLADSKLARPDKVEVELGLGFSAKGGVIVVSGQAAASLKVTLAYDAASANEKKDG